MTRLRRHDKYFSVWTRGLRHARRQEPHLASPRVDALRLARDRQTRLPRTVHKRVRVLASAAEDAVDEFDGRESAIGRDNDGGIRFKIGF